jgi:hypothetical protein
VKFCYRFNLCSKTNFVLKWGQKIWEGLLLHNSTDLFLFFFSYCGLGSLVPADSKFISEILFCQLRFSVSEWSDRLRTRVRLCGTECPLLHHVHTDCVAHLNLGSCGYRRFFPQGRSYCRVKLTRQLRLMPSFRIREVLPTQEETRNVSPLPCYWSWTCKHFFPHIYCT